MYFEQKGDMNFHHSNESLCEIKIFYTRWCRGEARDRRHKRLSKGRVVRAAMRNLGGKVGSRRTPKTEPTDSASGVKTSLWDIAKISHSLPPRYLG